MSEIKFDTVDEAIRDIAVGKAVVVVDDADRENEGDLVFAASKATPELTGFMIRHTSGVICVAMEGRELDRLELPPMTAVNQDAKGTAYAVSVDARGGVSTGISATDRAHTIRVLCDSATEARELTRPGHVFPLRYREGGVLVRPGHTEASVDLARLAGLTPAGALAEIVHDDGSMMRLPALRAFATEQGLKLISIAALIAHRRTREQQLERVAEAKIPTRHGEFRAIGFRNVVDGTEHLALVRGDLGGGQSVLVRVHSECLTGDVFDSLRCDCGPQLDAALEVVATEGRGVVVYLRGHEGRGIGLLHKLRAYQLQDSGSDTVDANLELGLPADARDYGSGAQVLAELGIHSMRLLTNNPAKCAALELYGLSVAEQIPITVAAGPHNLRYLTTKRDRMGHDIAGLPELDLVPISSAAASAAAKGADEHDYGYAGIVSVDDVEQP